MCASRRLVAAAIVLVCTAAPSLAQPASANKLFVSFQPIVARANASTVRILCNDRSAALGTIVAPDGLILTKASELRGAVTVKLGDGKELKAKLLATDKKTDLALLQIAMSGLKAVSFADTKKEPIGNWLAAAGTGRNPIAVGIISVMTRNLSGHDAMDDENHNQGYLGVILSETDDPEGGAIIKKFNEDRGSQSAARRAGLKIGDSIISVNGKTVTGYEMLHNLLQQYSAGDTLKVKVRRNSDELTFSVTLRRLTKPNRSDMQNSMGGKLSGRRSGFATVLQTDMILDPENCGGPVVDLEGKVLGLSIARAGRVETWVLPSEVIRPVLAAMIKANVGKLPLAPPPRLKKK